MWTTCANAKKVLPLALALVLTLPALAQVRQSEPIKVEVEKPDKVKFKGEVLAMTRVTLIVRSRENINLVRTFTYDKKLAEKMAKLIDEDKAYQHGDRVTIEYLKGTDTAVKIKGKPGQKR